MPRQRRASRAVTALLPSFTDVAFAAPLIFLFGKLDGAATLLGDGDTGWHIRAGEWMLANGRVPRTDMFSFTRPGEPWFAWEWLWDLCFGWLHQAAGMEAVVLASVLVLSVTSALLYRLVRSMCGNVPVAIGVTLLAVMASSIHWLARPHLFTMLFLVVFLGLVERARAGRPLVLAWLPVLMVLWTNLHGGFVAGLILIGGYVAGDVAAALLLPAERSLALERARWCAAAGAACAVATFANPYGYLLHVHVVGYLLEPFHFENIGEFLSLNFHHPVGRYFEALLVAGAASAFWHLRRGRVARAVLICGWAHLALYSTRHIPLFAIVAAPAIASAAVEMLRGLADAPVAGWLRGAVRAFGRAARDAGKIDRLPRLHVASAAAAVLVAALLYAPAPPKAFRAAYDPQRYPAAAMASLSAADRIFSDDEWGDFLIYSGRSVFVDGRSDFYGAVFERNFMDVLRVKHGWEEELGRYRVNTVLLPVGAPLVGALKESRRWRVDYDDGIAIIFRTGEPAVAPAPSVAKRVPLCPQNVSGRDPRMPEPKSRRVTT